MPFYLGKTIPKLTLSFRKAATRARPLHRQPLTQKALGSPLPNIPQIISKITEKVPADSPPKPPGIIEASGGMNSTVWTEVAQNAWNFFIPGVGVDNILGYLMLEESVLKLLPTGT